MAAEPLAAQADAVARMGEQRAEVRRLQARLPGAVEHFVDAQRTLEMLDRNAGGLRRLIGMAPDSVDVEAARDAVDSAEKTVDDLKRRIRESERATVGYERERAALKAALDIRQRELLRSDDPAGHDAEQLQAERDMARRSYDLVVDAVHLIERCRHVVGGARDGGSQQMTQRLAAAQVGLPSGQVDRASEFFEKAGANDADALLASLADVVAQVIEQPNAIEFELDIRSTRAALDDIGNRAALAGAHRWRMVAGQLERLDTMLAAHRRLLVARIRDLDERRQTLLLEASADQ